MAYAFLSAFVVFVVIHSVAMSHIRSHLALKHLGIWLRLKASANPQQEAVFWTLGGNHKVLADPVLNKAGLLANTSLYCSCLSLLLMAGSLTLR